jgi:type I restriction enzyme S subunit
VIHSLARYDAYKDSGVEWLGDVPAHWEVTRNKDIFEERGDLSISGDETLLTVSHITGVTRRTEKNVNMFMAETMEGYKLCQAGDLIVNTMWAWMGALGTANETGICSPAYGVYRPKKHTHYNHKYFDYLYRTPNAVTEMTKNSKGIVSSRLRLYPKDFFQIQTALPEEAEQTAIANYLDKKTAQLDRKIDLLSQKATQYGKLKQSLINETVTHGLDKSVPMKDSGVKWIGEVPAHWELKRLKEDVSLFHGYSFSEHDFAENISDKFLVKITELQGNKVLLKESSAMLKDCPEFEKYRIKKSDILIALSGATAGKISIFDLDEKCYLNQRVAKVLGSKKYNYKYLFFFLNRQQVVDVMYVLSNITAQPNFNNNILFISSLMPPLFEQQAIAAYLDEKITHIDHIVATINTQIDKLKELRKTLINDIVTGKICIFKQEASHE